MLLLIVVNRSLLRRHATNAVVRRIRDRGQNLLKSYSKVTPKAHARHGASLGWKCI